MSQLKEQNGRYYQQCKVVMLATDNKGICWLNNNNRKPRLETYPPRLESFGWKGQHLYFLSNDEIKEGDWIIINGTNGYSQPMKYIDIFPKDKFPNGHNDKILKILKIIATTNESLGLPKPSDSFIKKYIEEYNKGNQITDVLIEYWGLNNYSEAPYKQSIGDLKIDSDNTITIKKVKDSYSREEVIELVTNSYNSGYNTAIYHETNKSIDLDISLEDWIKQNL